jgi:hypothetical protein
MNGIKSWLQWVIVPVMVAFVCSTVMPAWVHVSFHTKDIGLNPAFAIQLWQRAGAAQAAPATMNLERRPTIYHF